jgi:hypothetical protein
VLPPQLVQKAFSKDELCDKEGVQQCYVAAVLDGKQLTVLAGSCDCAILTASRSLLQVLEHFDHVLQSSSRRAELCFC